MPATTIKVDKFLGLTELPLYSQPKGKLKACQNFRVTPDGLLEARGGLEKLLPSGGTATAPIASGLFTGAHEHNSPVSAIIRQTAGGAASTNNLALQAYIDIFSATAVDNRIHFISQTRFSRITLNIGTAGIGAYTVGWWYYDAAGAAHVLPGVAEDFKTGGARTVSFSPPSDWAPNAINNYYGYTVSAITAGAVIGTMPTQKDQRIYFGSGAKEIYLGSSDNAAGSTNGTVARYGQVGTVASWPTVTTSLASTGNPRIRFSSWRGYLYWVNGIDQKRCNMDSVADVGFTTPAGALTVAVSGTGLTGLFQYSVRYGYGAAGELGESDAFLQTNTVGAGATFTTTLVNQGAQVTLSGLTGVPAKGTADIIYLYRSVDLSTVALATSYGAFPNFRVATVTRDANGNFPATVTDSTMAIPIPVKTGNQATVAAPTRCQFIAVHRSRMFLGRNDQYPGRIWWSKNFEPESFNQDEDFADLTRSTGGFITGMIEFADQIIAFTEDAMYGVANVDQDVPNVYIIAPGIGCVASESLRTGYGLLAWASRGGIYVWDGTNPPERVSDDLAVSLGKLSIENHGRSWAAIYDRLYEITLLTNADVKTGNRYRYDLATRSWSTSLLTSSDANLGALMTLTAPLGHEDFGVRHPLYGKVQATGSLFHVYVGEWKVVDDGNSYSCAASFHVGPGDNKTISPLRLTAVYKNPTPNPAWTTPSLALAVGNMGDPTGLGAVFQESGLDYAKVSAQNTKGTSYTSDLIASFVTTSQAGGTANRQYLLAMYLDGNVMDQPLRTN